MLYRNTDTGIVSDISFDVSGVSNLVPVANGQANTDAEMAALLAQLSGVQAASNAPATGTPAPSNGGLSSFGGLDAVVSKWLGINQPTGGSTVTTGTTATGTPAGTEGATPSTTAALGTTGSVLAALGVSAPVIATLGALYLASEAIGVQYPWETGPGEGFIAPWNRNIVKDESGRWVTPKTRPDLFPSGTAASTPPPLINGSAVVKMWKAGQTVFAMTADGRIHTTKKSGVEVSYRPYHSIVIGKTLKTSQIKRVSKRIKSHVKALRTVLSIVK